MQTTWTDKYLVSSYDVDPQAQLPLPSLGKFLQETAYNHANHLEFGYSHLQEQNLFWVLSRLVIRMTQFPRWNDHIFVSTWPRAVEGILAYRDFEIWNEQEHVIGGASSAWLVLDREKRRPQRMTQLQESIHLLPDKGAIPEQPVKLHAPDTYTESPAFQVRYSDLDLYDHVNNAKYMQWLLDTYPADIHRNYSILLFEINFLSETRLEDQAFIQTQITDESEDTPVFLHCIRRKQDNKSVCMARISWKKHG